MQSHEQRETPERLRPTDCHLDDLRAVLAAPVAPSEYPHASDLVEGVLVYDATALRNQPDDPGSTATLEAELARALDAGPGIVLFPGAFASDTVQPVSDAFQAIIDAEKASGRRAGDHFAGPGVNDRVWNALEKLATRAPDAFVDYYANDMLALAARSWLGPGYQVTSQVNVVKPGGAGQTMHRDYHLGFQGPEVSATFPTHAHRLSPMLTLQGAVAHGDMPVASGPTLYLPHSQKYLPGYLAYGRQDFQEYFVDHHVQLPLRTGDAVFFNPALFHAAGSNHSPDIRRMANLLQISSAFGRAMEVVDRGRVVREIYPSLLDRARAGLTPAALARVVAASAEGYAFPTNLDWDPPIDGMSPRTQADVVLDALAAGATPEALATALQAHALNRRVGTVSPASAP